MFDALSGTIESFDGNGFVIRLGDLERDVSNWCEFLSVVLGVHPLDTEEDVLDFEHDLGGLK